MQPVRRRPPLAVFMNGRRVGTLTRHGDGGVEFQYHGEWLALDNAIPVSSSMPIREDRYTGERVVAVFDNLLPDNKTVRQHIAARLKAPEDIFGLLGATGRDCVGALQFLPEGEAPEMAGEIRARPVGEAEIAAILRNLTIAPLGLEANSEFRISIAGAQEKTALLWHEGRWHIPLGDTPTTHILKPQIGVTPEGFDLSRSVENEYFCMKLIKALGMAIADVEIADFEDRRVLVVERFDRRWTRTGRLLRLPQEDGCQALSVPVARKYEADGGPGVSDLLQLLKGADDAQADRLAFLRAQIVFWLLGATDGHAKNFSLRLSPGGRFQLAPLYDVVSVQPVLDAGSLRRRQMAMAMAIGDNRYRRVDTVRARHFIQTAKANGVDPAKVQAMFEDLRSTAPAALDAVVSALPNGFDAAVAGSISKGFLERLGLP